MFHNNNMKKNHLNILITLLIILVSIYIIRTLKLMGICCMILSILSPLLFGYVLSWIIKPIVDKIKFNRVVTTIIIYLLFAGLITLILFNFPLLQHIVQLTISNTILPHQRPAIFPIILLNNLLSLITSHQTTIHRNIQSIPSITLYNLNHLLHTDYFNQLMSILWQIFQPNIHLRTSFLYKQKYLILFPTRNLYR